MLTVNKILSATAVAVFSMVATPAVMAQNTDLSLVVQGRDNPNRGGGKSGGGSDGGTSDTPSLQAWMNTEVGDAWNQGFLGQNISITVVDDFSSNYGYYGNLGAGTQLLRHGDWVYTQASMIAPSADMRSHDFYSGRSVRLDRKQLDVLNLSYGMFAAAGYSSVNWGPQEASILQYAADGSAVVVKAAGNDGVAVGQTNSRGQVDYLNIDLIGSQAAIFVGALNSNGTTSMPTSLASYSNFAGDDVRVQNQFLSVGVRGDLTGLYGTSFAAPIVSGYAAIVGSKFSSATPTQIANQLLDTARTDTISGYNAALHGQGEASIARALAPVSIR